jgi:hypothetical protein
MARTLARSRGDNRRNHPGQALRHPFARDAEGKRRADRGAFDPASPTRGNAGRGKETAAQESLLALHDDACGEVPFHERSRSGSLFDQNGFAATNQIARKERFRRGQSR